jgi:signal transduction histidine kinase
MEATLTETVAATRRIATGLRPLMLDDLGLVPSIEWLVENFGQRTGIACELSIGDRDLHLSHEHATAIFRIIQESLTNVAKHARATSVNVRVSRDDGRAVIEVADDGRGGADAAGSGLRGLADRVEALAGRLAVTSAAGTGTTLRAEMPCA